jgi:4-amino-4-deoxy-L-arabinose transferase-like glycosyltransferase
MKKIAFFVKKIKNDERFLIRFLFSITLLIYFIFSFNHLGDFISADEHFWLPNSGSERIQDYWKAVGDQKWKNTRINDKPGITLAYTSGIALLFDHNLKSQIIKKDGTVTVFNPEKTKQINVEFRLPIVLLTGFFSLFFFWIIRKITDDEWIALFSVAGMLLSPVLLGMSQIVNPDSLFWIFASASIFSFFAFLLHSGKKLGILASVFLGLGLASKYVSVILFPFFFFTILVYYFFEYEKWQTMPKEFAAMVKKNALSYVAILAGSMLIFAILMPASFVEPDVFYAGTIGFPGMQTIFWSIMLLNVLFFIDAWLFSSRFLRYLLEKLQPLKKILPKLLYLLLAGTMIFILFNWLTRNSIINLSNIPFNLKRNDSFSEMAYYKRFIMEFLPLTFSLTPVVMFSLLFFWIVSFFEDVKNKTFGFVLSAFFLIFMIAVIKEGLLITVRYSIILFPLSAVLAAMAIRHLFSSPIGKKTRLVFLALLCSVLLLWISALAQQNYFPGIKNTFVEHVYNKWYSIIAWTLMILLAVRILFRYLPWARFSHIPRAYIFSTFVLCNVVSILLIAPFYFSYTSDLLPKNYIINGAWGYGGYEAAQYMNALPDAKKLTLWTDVYGVCEFFVGSCIHKAKVDTSKYKIDYYFRSLQSTIPLNFSHPMEAKPVWSEHIDGRSKSFMKLNKAKPDGAVDDSVNTASDIQADEE